LPLRNIGKERLDFPECTLGSPTKFTFVRFIFFASQRQTASYKRSSHIVYSLLIEISLNNDSCAHFITLAQLCNFLNDNYYPLILHSMQLVEILLAEGSNSQYLISLDRKHQQEPPIKHNDSIAHFMLHISFPRNY
jgi:hypothetical protein